MGDDRRHMVPKVRLNMTVKIQGTDPDSNGNGNGGKSRGPRPVKEYTHWSGKKLVDVLRADGKGLSALLPGAQRGKARYSVPLVDALATVSNVGYIEVTTRGGKRACRIEVSDLTEKSVERVLAFLDPTPMGTIAQSDDDFDLESFEDSVADLD